MAGVSYLIIIGIFVLYYLAILIWERRFIEEPREIIDKFLAVVLGYAGVSLIYFSLTGQPLLSDSIEEYYIYTFIIGFIAILWALPTLLKEFRFFRNFTEEGKKIKRKVKKGKK